MANILYQKLERQYSDDGGNTWRTIHEHLTNIGYNVLEEPVIFSPHYLGIPLQCKRSRE